MCTLTFIPREGGYLLAMNRDERFTRAPALPPRVLGAAVYPHESGGGTWIAASRHGIALALLNRSDGAPPAAARRSRGEIIPALILSAAPGEALRLLEGQALDEVAPFRLVGIFPAGHEAREWTWDGRTLHQAALPWERRHWFSSGLGDEAAAAGREPVCRAAGNEPAAGSPEWLRALHRSHRPQRGAFSLCVHRGEAGTLSYTEIEAGPGVAMFYQAGPPCSPQGPPVRVTLPGAVSCRR